MTFGTKRDCTQKIMRTVLLVSALTSVLIVVLIFVFTAGRAAPAFHEIGIWKMVSDTTWRPGSGEFGILAMIAGSGIVTLGAVLLGVPLALGSAVFLAEIAPEWIAGAVRPSIELLAGIPSVVYGLFGMAVIVPMVRTIPAPGNAGYGVLSASVVLAVMILPTVTSISELAIRSVPAGYREGSLALGATKWETVRRVLIPAAKPGIVSAVILGLGRALGETVAMIMVIGNSAILPAASTGNPLSIFLSRARTLTGNIAVEISYATGVHESALFATGVVLFVLIMLINSSAALLLKKGVR
ncbi:MAG: phosphate ABC transporter permease subunit PstC [Gemmatimonadaceae bacterium 4484_173]|nr:MAG: phosphate ABC transporter permease subunit PstC [Gemmatimonadaceae bacterium 4484_173]RKZ05142.1 MAG: phosphate ABC transporter permease subunit PstC [Candidatus Fermentibacteria bacterium]